MGLERDPFLERGAFGEEGVALLLYVVEALVDLVLGLDDLEVGALAILRELRHLLVGVLHDVEDLQDLALDAVRIALVVRELGAVRHELLVRPNLGGLALRALDLLLDAPELVLAKLDLRAEDERPILDEVDLLVDLRNLRFESGESSRSLPDVTIEALDLRVEVVEGSKPFHDLRVRCGHGQGGVPESGATQGSVTSGP